MKWNLDIGELFFKFIVFMIMFFLIFPIIVTILVSFNKAGFVLPPSGLTLRWYKMAFTSEEFNSGIRVSLLVAFVTSAFATILGIINSYALTRYSFKGRDLINLLIMSPLIIPVAISGFAIYVFLYKLGTFEGSGFFPLFIGHTILTVVYSTRVISASLQNFSRSLEEAAMNVGADSIKTFIYITLPLIKTGIIAGMMMCFIVSWNNFALSLFLASPGWYPLPIQIYSYVRYSFDPSTSALVSCLIFFSFVFVILIDRVIGLSVVVGKQI